MAEAGEIPCHLASLKGGCLICVACLFGNAHKCPWHSKSKERYPFQKESDNYPGAKASLNQLVLAQPKLIPQISGTLTCMQINGATIFVDHQSNHFFVFLMQNLTLDETILAKHAYEQFPASIGVTSKAYHADNGRFSDKGFHDDCTSCNQVITFCSIGSHHQNVVAEQKIKELTLGGQALLLHAKGILPEYISTILKPFALKCCKDCLKILFIMLMVKRHMKRLLVWNPPKLSCQISILLAVHAMFEIISFSLEMEQFQNGSLALEWAFMLVIHPHMLLTLHSSLIQGQATSHLNSMLSLMMIFLQCNIFALARSHHIGRTLYIPLPQFRCILKSKWEPGNQF
jgi:hypothetical protein